MLRYHDNITKIFCGAASNVLVFLISVFIIGDQELSGFFVAGAACCAVGAYKYQIAQAEKG